MLHQVLHKTDRHFVAFRQLGTVILVLHLHAVDVERVADGGLLLLDGNGFLEGNLEENKPGVSLNIQLIG